MGRPSGCNPCCGCPCGSGNTPTVTLSGVTSSNCSSTFCGFMNRTWTLTDFSDNGVNACTYEEVYDNTDTACCAQTIITITATLTLRYGPYSGSEVRYSLGFTANASAPFSDFAIASYNKTSGDGFDCSGSNTADYLAGSDCFLGDVCTTFPSTVTITGVP